MADVKASFPKGIVGASLTTLEQLVPDIEPPPLPVNAELKVVGKRTPRLDGRAKVTGAARYTADVRLPGMLYAATCRSPHPHARIKSIDVRAATALAGVRATHVLEHLLLSAQMKDKAAELPSPHPIVRYVGQPIAAVAASTQSIADDAARLIEVEYDLLPFVVDLDEARKPGAPTVFPGPAAPKGSAGGGGGAQDVPQNGNVRGPTKGGPLGPPRGDVEAGLKAADVVVDATFRTQVQTHAPLETHGVVADWKDEGLTVYASTQGTSTVRDELAEIFGLPKNKVQVITEFMGGGFGAKFGAGNFGVLAVSLSKKAKAPVRLMLDRKEEHQAVGNRPSSIQRLRVGAKNNGSLTAIVHESYGSGGTGGGAGTAGPAKNMYPCPNILTEEYDVFTHTGPAQAFRAPGHPQGCFALEQVIDELAERLAIDPLALRDKIDFDEDQDGRNVDSSARKEERRLGAAKIGWSKRHAPGADGGPIKRGIGVAQSIWYRIIDMDAACEVRVARDGSVEILSAVQDIGTGIRTVLAQVVAEELGLTAEAISVRIGDTSFPIGPASGGSKTTGSITPAARNAAYGVRRKLAAALGVVFGVPPADVMFEGGKVFPKGAPDKGLAFRAATARMKTEQIAERTTRSPDYGKRGAGSLGVGGLGGVQFAAVSVDTRTGVVQVERVVAVHDCGRPINPLALESQINGGVIQGISYALYENRVMDRGTGHMLNANLEQYKIAGAFETPPIEIVLLEEYHAKSSTDAAGIGEPATIPTAAAIANAVYNATGVRVRELPMTPAVVLAALAGKKAP